MKKLLMLEEKDVELIQKALTLLLSNINSKSTVSKIGLFDIEHIQKLQEQLRMELLYWNCGK